MEQELAAELEHKNEQLQMAAQLGQSLLHKTEQLSKANADLERERDGCVRRCSCMIS